LEHWIVISLLLSFAVSFDSYAFGFTYSLRSIKVNYTIYLLVGIMTALSFIIGHLIGHSMALMIPQITDLLGSVVFIGIGCFILWQWVDEQRTKLMKYQHNYGKVRLNIRTIWNILNNPDFADFDQSGSISGKESFYVAIALSIDSFGTGVGSYFISIPVLITGLLIGISSIFFLAFGYLTGNSLRSFKWTNQLTFLPGIIFISLGIWNFMK